MEAAKSELKAVEEELEKTKMKGKKFLHIIPHSHTDLGWLSTMSDFYTGNDEQAFYIGSVKDILDTSVAELLRDPKHTFTFAETKYFQTWFYQQNDEMKQKVRGLVQSGRLDLVSGGWSAPDEATTQYDSIIDNFMMG